MNRFDPAVLTQLGLSAEESRELAPLLERASSNANATDAWRTVSQTLLKRTHPFAVHRHAFDMVYRDWKEESGPRPAWLPTSETNEATNLNRLMRSRGQANFPEFRNWAAAHRSEFWETIVGELGIAFDKLPEKFLDVAEGVKRPRWFVGAQLNIVNSCFNAPADQTAILHQREGSAIEMLSYAELQSLAGRVSHGLIKAGLKPGHALAIAMPMTAEAVAIYLGIVQAGMVVVSIADSLAADQISVRLRIAKAKGIFTQDVVHRGGKEIPLYARLVDDGCRAIVIPAGKTLSVWLRPGDISWADFLATDDCFKPIAREPADPTNILFSSGTTGEPKAIPWDQTSPLKAAADAYLLQDVQPPDRVAWPTNIGWMMGPWLIYASLINRATMALYDGAPTSRGFGQFVSQAGVSILGVVPSLVKTWRNTSCLEGLDWSKIRHFSSTGECSNPDDMLFLMSLAGYKPVIEYCGGTELAGAYISSTRLEPNAPSVFTTAAPGMDFVILDDEGRPADLGEAFLVPPSIGMSTRMLNRDHDAVYFDGVPRGADGIELRRHGDAIERLPGGYFRAHGRVDDTMNLGGIKVSSAEIERVLNTLPDVVETAAIAVEPSGGGPSLLEIFAVPTHVDVDCTSLLAAMRSRVREELSPLFKIERLTLIDAMPRTASNKVMRRLLRDRAIAKA